MTSEVLREEILDKFNEKAYSVSQVCMALVNTGIVGYGYDRILNYAQGEGYTRSSKTSGIINNRGVKLWIPESSLPGIVSGLGIPISLEELLESLEIEWNHS